MRNEQKFGTDRAGIDVELAKGQKMGCALHLDVSARRTDTALIREIHLKRDGRRDVRSISYEMVGGTGPEYPAALDGFVLGVLLHAMDVGEPLWVHGPMSRTALYNLEELQSFWRRWRPRRYKHIEIRPEAIVDLERRKPIRRAMATFSGGADSTFTLLRHGKRRLRSASYELGAALLVHGFDVDLANTVHFERLVERLKPFLDECGLDLRIIRTNIRAPDLQGWEDGHGAMLASCLHQYSHEFEFGIIAGTDPYHQLNLAYGSNPVTDHLLSGDALAITQDGAGFTKVEKIALISSYPTAMRGLRVCWEGKDQYRNCGRCGKCVRIRLAFMAVGVPNPPCFDGSLDLSAIDVMTVPTRLEYDRLAALAAYADGRNVKEEWLRRVKKRMATFRREVFLRGARNSVEENLGAALAWAGLEDPIKRGLRTFGIGR
jgi:hypothetical protein